VADIIPPPPCVGGDSAKDCTKEFLDARDEIFELWEKLDGARMHDTPREKLAAIGNYFAGISQSDDAAAATTPSLPAGWQAARVPDGHKHEGHTFYYFRDADGTIRKQWERPVSPQ